MGYGSGPSGVKAIGKDASYHSMHLGEDSECPQHPAMINVGSDDYANHPALTITGKYVNQNSTYYLIHVYK